MPAVSIPFEWTDIDDWNRHEAGTSFDDFYPQPPGIDQDTWVKVRRYKFKNTYNNEVYFYAPRTLVEPLGEVK